MMRGGETNGEIDEKAWTEACREAFASWTTPQAPVRVRLDETKREREVEPPFKAGGPSVAMERGDNEAQPTGDRAMDGVS